jgi:protein-S-isoprenylcysteine O-methyltransferase Ste14
VIGSCASCERRAADIGMLSRILTHRFAGNYFSTMAAMGLSYWIIRHLSGFHREAIRAAWQLGHLDIDFVITIHQLFVWIIALYAVVLVPFYARYPWLHSKAFVFAQGLWFAILRSRRPVSHARAARLARVPWRLPINATLSPGAKQAALALLLKFFFAPLMINWCLDHASNMTSSVVQLIDGAGQGIRGRALFDTWVFWAAFQLILFVDTFLFTIGYIVEIPALKNRIRSVDPTFFGWAICLCCYPPFNNLLTSRLFEWQSADFPRFENDAAHYVANIALLTALGIYSAASVALGLKASNLTNRGIIARGPYAYVRHPAYAAKNLAWWIGTLPVLHAHAGQNWRGFLYALLAMGSWTAIYALRAITEERHLLLANNGYAEYMQRVKWRFIPRVV